MEKPNEPIKWFYDAIDHAVSRKNDLTPDDEHEVYVNLSVMKSIRDHINEQAAYLDSLKSEVGRRRASIDDELRRRAVLNAQEGRAEPSATCNVHHLLDCDMCPDELPSYALATIEADSIIGHSTILRAYNDESSTILDEWDGDVVEVYPVGTAAQIAHTVSLAEQLQLAQTYIDAVELENAASLERITSVWPVLNRRRGELIDQDIKGTLVALDRLELDRLTSFADWYVHQVAPRPTAVLAKLEALLGRSEPLRNPE